MLRRFERLCHTLERPCVAFRRVTSLLPDLSSLMTIHRITFLLFGVGCGGLGPVGGRGPKCSQPTTDGQLLVSELDAYVRALPEAQRIAPEGGNREAWLEELIRAVAVEQVLEGSGGHPDANGQLRDRDHGAAGRSPASCRPQSCRSWFDGTAPSDDAIEARLQRDAGAAPRSHATTSAMSSCASTAPPMARRKQTVRRRAASILRRARQGEKTSPSWPGSTHSRAPPRRAAWWRINAPLLLEDTARRAIESLAEGEVSPIVESRTGLHIFRLERRLTPPAPGREQAAQRVRGHPSA